MKKKVIRIATVPIYMNIVLRGQLKYLSSKFHIIAITSPDSKHFHEIGQREGVKMYPVAIQRTIHIWKDLVALAKLIKIIIQEKPDIIHSHTPKAGLLGMTAGFLCAVPVRMHTVTGMPLLETSGITKLLLLLAERITYLLATHVYPNSYGMKEIIHSYHLAPDSKLKVLLKGSTNGVDTSFFDPELLEDKNSIRAQYGISKDSFVFLFVGRIAREKGIVELAEAIQKLDATCKDHFDVKLVLVGKFENSYGSLSSELEEFLETSPLVKMLGRFDDVRPFYKLADVFVLPSYREGFPNAVLEASSMQIPSIVSDINGCNEIIQDGTNGLIVTKKDSETLYAAMHKVLCNPNLRMELTGNTRKMVVSGYDRKMMLETIGKEYENLLNTD
jgi:glycosyltransferase involved in cell wall biosynthesis